jgi:hypothetical protein
MTALRYDWHHRADALLSLVLNEFGHFPMMRRMLPGIKRRAETRRSRPPDDHPRPERGPPPVVIRVERSEDDPSRRAAKPSPAQRTVNHERRNCRASTGRTGTTAGSRRASR